MSRSLGAVLGLVALAAAVVAVALAFDGGEEPSRDAPRRSAGAEAKRPGGAPPVDRGPGSERIGRPGPRHAREPAAEPPPGGTLQRPPAEPFRWRHSVAVGTHTDGRLVRGMRLPSEGTHFFTWDPVLKRTPNRPWRRWGTDRLVRTVLRVAREHRMAHPLAPRITVGDLSRPRGGDFGPRFGDIGHVSHQNGLDVDIYYPRADRRERAPRNARQIDRRLSQSLVNRFLRHGAQVIFVGPHTGLTGPPRRVQPLINHDNHLHVRLPVQR